jgi:hypothetical protein
MKKETKRKAFNFLRSYFDVLNEIPEDKDKLSFLISIINKQFLNEDPEKLDFIPNLCYESQRHSIETSVKGWLRATKDTLLTNPPTNPMTNPMTNPKEEEEEEEEKEEAILHLYKKFVDEISKGGFATRVDSLYMNLKIQKGKLTPLLAEYQNHLISEDRLHKNTNDFFLNFKNWLNLQDRIKKLEQYKK